MDDEGTSVLQRAKEKAKGIANRKSVAIGGLSGGVSGATLLIVWQTFVPNAHFNQYRQESKQSEKAQWEQIQATWREAMSLDKRLAILEDRAVRTNR